MDGDLARWEGIEDDVLVWRRGVESSSKDGSSKDREVRMFRENTKEEGELAGLCDIEYKR